MTSQGYALARAELIRVLTAHTGITTDDGAVGGTSLRDRLLIGRNDFITGKTLLILTGNAKDEDCGAASFVPGTGIITLQGAGVNAQILAGTIYKVLNISSVEIDVKDIIDKLGAFTSAENLKAILGDLSTAKRLGQILGALTETNTLKAIIGAYTAAAPLKAAIDAIIAAIAAILHSFQEQADTAVNINAIAAGETNVLNLAAAGTRYIVRSLRVKCADPGANTVTVRLYELVNDVATVVTTFDITNANFGTYFSLMDMFGLPQLAGDNLRVTVQASAGGPYAVTAQYSYATAT